MNRYTRFEFLLFFSLLLRYDKRDTSSVSTDVWHSLQSCQRGMARLSESVCVFFCEQYNARTYRT